MYENNGHEPSKNENESDFEAKSVFMIGLITIMAFFLMSILFFSLAIGEVILRHYTEIPSVDIVMNDQEVILDEMVDFLAKGVSQWTGIMQITWMLNQSIIILPAFIFLRMKKFNPAVYLRLRPVPKIFLGLSIFIGLAVAVLGDELSRLVDFIKPIPDSIIEQIQQMLVFDDVSSFLTIFITVCVMAPLVEEAFFRGFLQRWLEKRKGVTSGVLSTSALFALIHSNMYYLVPILLMATILGAMAWRSESIWPSVIVHAVNNGTGLLVANTLGNEEPEWLLLGNHIAPWWLLLALAIIVIALRHFFAEAEKLGLGGHGPRGDSGTKINTLA